MNEKTYIIAEAGVNHNGSLEMAKQLVDAAKQSEADAVKFQTFKAEDLVTKQAKQADYQINNLREETSQFQMLKNLELTYNEFKELSRYCNEQHIEFLSTPFDHESVDFLLNELKMERVKIPSGELTNTPFIHYIATKRKPIILSTGMATIEDIHTALSFIAFGLAYPERQVDEKEVAAYYGTDGAKVLLNEFVTVLHCTTEYPAPFETVNLKAISAMRKEFHVPIGLSDHSTGISVPVAAAALEAVIIEKHFTIDRNLEGPDHLASLEPNELTEMIRTVREVELSLGTGEKSPTAAELKNRLAARKSIVARKNIMAGELLTEHHLAVKRPGTGMAPIHYWTLLGKNASKDYEKDEPLNE